MGPGFKAAIVQTDALEIRALPRGAVFYDREPVFTVTGQSALVSWLEPLVLMLHGLPGRPVLWRRMQGGGPTGIIGQEGEAAPGGYEAWGSAPADPKYVLEFSPETRALQTKLRRTR
jgi:hypothetical protein